MWHRRDVLKSSLAVGAAALMPRIAHGWSEGDLEHLIPGANHDRFLVKASFRRALSPPRLEVADPTEVPTTGEHQEPGASRPRLFAASR